MLWSTDDVDQLHTVGQTDAIQHLAEVRCGGGVNERGMAFRSHRLDHRKRGERVDETRRALRWGCAVGKVDQHHRRHSSVLGVGGAANDCHQVTNQCLRVRRGARGNDDATALVAHRHRLADARD